jgi:hypothetical protein
LRRLVAALAAGGLALVACGGDDDTEGALRPAIELIEPAISALEQELGGPQDFFEVTADPQLVRLYVAREQATRAAPYVYVGGEVAPAGDLVGAGGGTFPGDAVDVDPDTVLAVIEDELDDPDVVLFSIAGNGTGAVQYVATVRSAKGGLLDVVVADDGAILSVAPRT